MNINELNITELEWQNFSDAGILIIPRALSKDYLEQLTLVIDHLHIQSEDATNFNDRGRWDMRNCLPRHNIFADMAADRTILRAVAELFSWNIKLLGSHIVKMAAQYTTENFAIDWHRDGGVVSAELPDPLPPLFIKIGFCISGSAQNNGGELLMVPGSHRLTGEPCKDESSNLPRGTQEILLSPGDVVIFDWRIWHAVSQNISDAIRRMLYLTFGFRWLAPMDYETMPEELANRNHVYRQLFGRFDVLNNYLPQENHIPIKSLVADTEQYVVNSYRREVKI